MEKVDAEARTYFSLLVFWPSGLLAFWSSSTSGLLHVAQGSRVALIRRPPRNWTHLRLSLPYGGGSCYFLREWVLCMLRRTQSRRDGPTAPRASGFGAGSGVSSTMKLNSPAAIRYRNAAWEI
ncbi:hypothetical protein F4780DRAFT_532030 [Xylariomycetidae sp. FL0641]|nr:hypothetical protein F4780DRAFT_532030 [Xylariomycetidae sp. FL0641]